MADEGSKTDFREGVGMFVLSAEDVKVLKAVVDAERARTVGQVRRPRDPTVDLADHPAPDVYIARIPDAGIPAGAGQFPGVATCKIFRASPWGGGQGPFILSDAGFARQVFNLSDQAILQGIPGLGMYIPIARDKWGSWFALPWQMAAADKFLSITLQTTNPIPPQYTPHTRAQFVPTGGYTGSIDVNSSYFARFGYNTKNPIYNWNDTVFLLAFGLYELSFCVRWDNPVVPQGARFSAICIPTNGSQGSTADPAGGFDQATSFQVISQPLPQSVSVNGSCNQFYSVKYSPANVPQAICIGVAHNDFTAFQGIVTGGYLHLYYLG